MTKSNQNKSKTKQLGGQPAEIAEEERLKLISVSDYEKFIKTVRERRKKSKSKSTSATKGNQAQEEVFDFTAE